MPKHTLRRAVPVLLGLTVLAGCSLVTPTSPAPTPSRDAASSPEPSPTPSASPTPEYDVAPLGPWTPQEPTAPGTTLPIGEPAWLLESVSQGGESVGYLIGTAPIQIIPGNPALFDKFDNAEEFAGYTPYYIVLQLQLSDNFPVDGTPPTIAHFPLRADGNGAEYLLSSMFGGSTMMSVSKNDCGLALPPYDETTKTLMTCIVAMTNDGQPVTGTAYTSESYEGGFSGLDLPNPSGEAPPYEAAPVLWQ